MTHPDDDMLAALALGESTPNDVAAHVGGCAPCSREVTALRSTLSVLREPVPALIAPPASVWDAVLAEIDAPETAAAPPTATVADLPAAPTAVDHAVAAPATAQPPRGASHALMLGATQVAVGEATASGGNRAIRGEI